jgi:aspartyl/asparaginyl-tRNA synthetase
MPQDKSIQLTLTSQLMWTVRQFFNQRGFVEVAGPSIQRAVQIPFGRHFGVSHGKLQGNLSQGDGLVLTETLADLKRLVSIDPVFRPETPNDPNHLMQYRLIYCRFAGSLDDAFLLIESLIASLRSVFLSSDQQLFKTDHLANFQTPFARLKYEEAARLAGVASNQDFSYRDQLTIVKKSNKQAVFVQNGPAKLAPTHFDYKQSRKNNLSFDLLAPHGGEIASGGVIETDEKVLRRQIENSDYRKASLEAGNVDFDKNIEPYIKAIGTLSGGPHVTAAISFERTLQYMFGTRTIAEAAVYPTPVREAGVDPFQAAVPPMP